MFLFNFDFKLIERGFDIRYKIIEAFTTVIGVFK